MSEHDEVAKWLLISHCYTSTLSRLNIFAMDLIEAKIQRMGGIVVVVGEGNDEGGVECRGEGGEFYLENLGIEFGLNCVF